MSVNFKGRSVNAKDILAAMRYFDSKYKKTKNYDSWLDKKNYKYAVRHNRKLYPCKRILSQATAIDTSEFSGGEQTNRVFRRLKFRVIDKP